MLDIPDFSFILHYCRFGGFIPAFGFEWHKSGSVQRHHNERDKYELNDNTGYGGQECSGQEDAEGKRAVVKAEHERSGYSPYRPSGNHCGYHAKINGFNRLVAHPLVQKSGHECVCGELKRHADSRRKEGRHGEYRRAHKRENERHRRGELPAADERAQKYRYVHWKKHIAYLRNLSGQEWKHKPYGKEHGGEGEALEIVLHLRLLWIVYVTAIVT